MSTSIRKSAGSFIQPQNPALTDVDMFASQNVKDPYLVALEPEDNPQNMTLFRRWLAVLIISSAALCVTCASSIVSQFICRLGLNRLIILQAAFTEQGAAQTFRVSREVTVLGISLFVTGLGVGPLLVGPLSELYGMPQILHAMSYLQQASQAEISYTEYRMLHSSSSLFRWRLLPTSVSAFAAKMDD